jgi:hypothetical protein
MPNSIAVDIADALVAGLSAYTFSSPYASITATRRYVPDYEARELGTIKVSVVPGPVETERGSRAMDVFTQQVMVVIAKMVDGTNEDIDELTNLCQEIMDAIRSDVLAAQGMPENAKYFGCSMEVNFDRDSLTEKRVFLAQIDVTYRVPRYVIEPPA